MPDHRWLSGGRRRGPARRLAHPGVPGRRPRAGRTGGRRRRRKRPRPPCRWRSPPTTWPNSRKFFEGHDEAVTVPELLTGVLEIPATSRTFAEDTQTLIQHSARASGTVLVGGHRPIPHRRDSAALPRPAPGVADLPDPAAFRDRRRRDSGPVARRTRRSRTPCPKTSWTPWRRTSTTRSRTP